MNLGAPIFLAGLVLLVPVLLTFLVKRQRQIVRVPSTMVWRHGARSVVKNRRIRDLRRLLSLLACLVGVAALIVAAARPSGTRRDATIYVVDVSASMAPAIAETRRWLTRDVANRGRESRVAFVLAGAQAKVLLPPSPPGPAVDEAIASLKAESDIAALDDAVKLADGLAVATHARVVVVSDHPVDAAVSRAKAEAHVVGTRGENVGITSFFTSPTADARDDEEREANVGIATSSATPRRVRLVMKLDGHSVADRLLEVPAHGDVVERVTLRGAGRLVARVTPTDGKADLLAADDEAMLYESARRPPRVALVAKKAAGAYFVAKAIRAAGVTELLEVEPDDDAPKSAELAVVMNDGRARPSDVPTFFVGVEPEGLVTQIVDKAQTHLRSLATEDPLLRGVSLDDLTTVRARVARSLPRGARGLADLDGGPTLVSGGSGVHAWVWLGIDPEGSDLVLRVAFPVLVSNTLAQLGGATQVVAAKTLPRSEVLLESDLATDTLPATSEPRWRLPASIPAVIALVGALLLALEAWFTFKKRQPNGRRFA